MEVSHLFFGEGPSYACGLDSRDYRLAIFERVGSDQPVRFDGQSLVWLARLQLFASQPIAQITRLLAAGKTP